MTDAAAFAAEFTANTIKTIAELEATDTAGKWVVGWDNGLCVRVGRPSATSAYYATTFASESEARAEYRKFYQNGNNERATVRTYAEAVKRQIAEYRTTLNVLKEMGHA